MLPKILLFNIKKIKNRNLFVYQKLKFIIKRFYFHNNLKKGHIFGLHAHKKLKQIYICVSGSLKVSLTTNNEKKIYILNKGSKALYISNNVWREIETLTDNTVLCTLADQKYKKNDYLRNHNEFKKKNKIS
jgi:dTDP-4-dehydrorhamnose 3,5-epimerase-like enzyme